MESTPKLATRAGAPVTGSADQIICASRVRQPDPHRAKARLGQWSCVPDGSISPARTEIGKRFCGGG